MATKPKLTEQPAYESQHQGQLDQALSNVTNRQEFTYDPLKDANYQALAKVYNKQGNQAAQNTLGDAAALNGGYGSSYAVTASQQARNDYNQMLASQIPALQEAAYNRYLNEYNMNVTALSALRDADESAYGRYRDTVSDSQWKYGQEYQQYRDDVSDSQWQKTYDRGVYESDRDYNRGVYESNRDHNYQKSRDKVADSQWAQEFALQKKSAAASSRGEYSGSNGYAGPYNGSGGSSNSGSSFDQLWGATKKTYNNGLTAQQYASLMAKKGVEAVKKATKKKKK